MAWTPAILDGGRARDRLSPRYFGRNELVTVEARVELFNRRRVPVHFCGKELGLAQSYKKLFHRWSVVRGWIPAIIFTIVATGLELFFLNYIVGLGLIDQRVSIPLGLWSIPISIALLLSLGNVVVLLTLWMKVFESSAYVKAGPDRQVRRLLYPLRMVRMAALVLTPFTFLLFIPYVLQSAWFLGLLGSSTLFQGLGKTIYNWGLGSQNLEFSTRFIISQLIAAAGAVLVSGLQIWRVRGTRNLMILLRKKR